MAAPEAPKTKLATLFGSASKFEPVPSSIPAEVAAPSKRGPSAFILASLIETELNLPLREDLTGFL
jgi:hypothetical protein